MITSKPITFNTKIMGGQACVREMRIPVSVIVSLVANRIPRFPQVPTWVRLGTAFQNAALKMSQRG